MFVCETTVLSALERPISKAPSNRKNELTEDFYSCEVYGRINNNWINVEKTDSYNSEYDNLVQRMIQEMAKPYFVSFE